VLSVILIYGCRLGHGLTSGHLKAHSLPAIQSYSGPDYPEFRSGLDCPDAMDGPVMPTSGRIENEYDRVLSRSVECHREVSSDFEKKKYSRENE
jgi:hypothetical protein